MSYKKLYRGNIKGISRIYKIHMNMNIKIDIDRNLQIWYL